MTKITITQKQSEQFNAMRSSLLRISKHYETPDSLRRSSKKDWGLDYEEALEMAYENIQMDAKIAVSRVKEIKTTEP